MILTYHPAGSDEPKVWDIDLDDFRSADMEAIEDQTKMSFDTEFRLALYARNTKARRALLWTMLRKAHPGIKPKDVEFTNREVKIELNKDEWAALRDEAAKNPATSADTLAAIDGEIDAAPEAPGKDPTPSAISDASTE